MSTLDPHPKRTKLHLWIIVLYTLIILAALLMNIIELVRLALADRGIGLLPFTLVGLLLALALSFGVRGSMLRFSAHVMLIAYWVLMVVVSAIKTGTLVKLEGTEDRKGTKYPSLDQITDIAVLLVLYVILFLLELVQFRWLQSATRMYQQSADGKAKALHAGSVNIV